MKIKNIIGALTLLVISIACTGCTTEIFSLSLPEIIEVEQGSSHTLEIVYSTKKSATDEALKQTIEKIDLKWFSDDESVATVDDKGDVTGVKTGETNITVQSADGGLWAECKVKVVITPTKINTPEIIKVEIGDVKNINATVVPENATMEKLMYKSSDEAIAKVDEFGNVTAVGVGKCIIETKVMGIGDQSSTTFIVTAPIGEDE